MAALQGAGEPAPAVFVGNLSYDLTDQDIINYFGKCGPVKSVRIVNDRETGRPRGFGFVEFHDIPTAESAIRNLSGKEFNGRVIRIVFAEGGPFEARGGGFPSRGGPAGFGGAAPPSAAGGPPGGGFPGASRAPNASRVVGGDLAYHSALGAAQLLGGSGTPGQTADALTKLLARRSRSELYALLAAVQELAGADRTAARDLLASNPALAKALFQSQVILGYVSNPRGDVAPKGIAPPGTMPGRGFAGAAHDAPPAQYRHADPTPAVQYQGGTGGGYAAPSGGYAQGTVPAGLAPPAAGYGAQSTGYGAQSAGYGTQSTGYGAQSTGYGAQSAGYGAQSTGYGAQPAGYGAAPTSYGDGHEGAYAPMAPAGLAPAHGAGAAYGGGNGYHAGAGQYPPHADAASAVPADPRQRAGFAPGMTEPQQGYGGAPAHNAGPAAGLSAAAGMTPDQQQVLLEQVLSLTPAQLDQLPPDQKAQVLALQQQMRG
ncbi:hypothetical protein ACKKBG_A01185 [Auxenochlorella protothecoides x Auxenochlorella symbiontica]